MTPSDVDTVLAVVLDQDVHKACACGRTFTAHEWSLLVLVGEMVDEVESIELRNCPCGSTIAVTVDVYAPTPRPSDLAR